MLWEKMMIVVSEKNGTRKKKEKGRRAFKSNFREENTNDQ